MMHIHFNDHMRKIREQAAERAQQAGRAAATVGDLLHGLALTCPDLAAGFFDKLGTKLHLKKENVAAETDSTQASGGQPADEETSRGREEDAEQWDETCRRIFERAAGRAEDAREKEVGPEHLIISLLAEASHTAEQMLRNLVNTDKAPASDAEAGLVLKIKQREDCRELPLPKYMSTGASGMDLTAAVADDTVLEPGKTTLVPTGIYIAVPAGHEAQVRPRSGLALKASVTVLNTPGTIDCDYRGEISVILANFGTAPFIITRGMRIAQMVISPVVQVTLQLTDNLDETKRGSSGFGDSGT